MTIEEAVKSHFSVGRVDDVVIREEYDGDGSLVLRVRVVYNGAAGELLPDEMLSLSLALRPLTEASHLGSGYPVVSYVDSREIEPLHAAQ